MSAYTTVNDEKLAHKLVLAIRYRNQMQQRIAAGKHVLASEIQKNARRIEAIEDEIARRSAMTKLALFFTTDCRMCGKEGAIDRGESGRYCSQCWTIWNS